MSGEWVVYGHSDDCVEIKGADREELACYDTTAVVECAGEVWHLTYGENDAFWRFKCITADEGAESCASKGTDEDSDYSDRLTVYGQVLVVTIGDDVYEFRGRELVSDEVAKAILGVDGEFDSRDLDGGAAW